MELSSSEELLALFNITPDDVAILQASEATIRAVLPSVLDEMHRKAKAGSQLTNAIKAPEVRELRFSYWNAVATGG